MLRKTLPLLILLPACAADADLELAFSDGFLPDEPMLVAGANCGDGYTPVEITDGAGTLVESGCLRDDACFWWSGSFCAEAPMGEEEIQGQMRNTAASDLVEFRARINPELLDRFEEIGAIDPSEAAPLGHGSPVALSDYIITCSPDGIEAARVVHCPSLAGAGSTCVTNEVASGCRDMTFAGVDSYDDLDEDLRLASTNPDADMARDEAERVGECSTSFAGRRMYPGRGEVYDLRSDVSDSTTALEPLAGVDSWTYRADDSCEL